MPATSERMARVRQRGTGPEMAVRKRLHALGSRYFVQRELLSQPRRTADIVFPRQRVAIFIDGCFWHGCPMHATHPRNNAGAWAKKLAANRLRDADTKERLEAAGWTVLRFWAHEDPDTVAARILAAVASATPVRRSPRRSPVPPVLPVPPSGGA